MTRVFVEAAKSLKSVAVNASIKKAGLKPAFFMFINSLIIRINADNIFLTVLELLLQLRF
jgi:hypothetical protein